MANEIIDLTEDESPPSSPMPSSNTNTPIIPNFGVVSTANQNLYPMIHPHQTAQWQAPHTNDPSRVATRFYHGIHVGQVTTVLQPVAESNMFFFPNGVGITEPWTQREHESFLMGQINFGNGSWSEISRHFVWSRTPQQLQIYAASFFGHPPTTYVCGFIRRNPPPISQYFVSGGNHMRRNRNPMDTSASCSMPMNVANEAPLETITLFQENAPFSQVPPYRGDSTCNNITHGGSPSTSVTANGDIDLELRLG